ncbi:hypothetical protein [Hyphomonas sp.]|uniref:hypothetical protein n=1 Tax=Hyphomonas sp. TaxID=87 RepID=UPI0025C1E877|nr:hypothetical protein [Hyphomonas sp.]
MSDTLLVLTGIGIPAYSARGLTQTLQPIEAAGSQRRTVNGTLVDLSLSQFRKYRSTIRCSDMEAPALDGIWPGLVVTVDCVVELSCPSSATPAKTVVPGSQRLQGSFTFYRPRLVMQVIDHSIEKNEWGAVTGWTLELEEV